MTGWRVGETVTDAVAFDLPAGVYTVAVGWYDFFTGQRLLVLNDAGEAMDSQAVLGPFTINAPP